MTLPTTLTAAVQAVGGESNAVAIINRHLKQKNRDKSNRETLKWAKTPEGQAAIAKLREGKAVKTA